MGKRDKTSDGGNSIDLGTTTSIAGGITGVLAAAVTFWMELRQKSHASMQATGIFDRANARRNANSKALTEPTPDYFRQRAAIRSAYKEEVDVVLEQLGIKNITPKSIRLRFGMLKSSDKLEVLEKAGTFGFMAATLIIGLGVLLEMSRNQQLKHRIEEQQARALRAKVEK